MATSIIEETLYVTGGTGIEVVNNSLVVNNSVGGTLLGGILSDGGLWTNQEVTTDLIVERTGGAGVTIDGVLIKDGIIASTYLDADTAHLSGTQTFTGAKTFTANATIGTMILRNWTASDTDIDALIPGSITGGLIEAPDSAHVVVGIPSNDADDGFFVIHDSDNGGDYDQLSFAVRRDGIESTLPVSIDLGTITTDVKALDITATYNNAGTIFQTIEIDVIDTLSSQGVLFGVKESGAAIFSVYSDLSGTGPHVVSRDFSPITTNTYDIGSATLSWEDAYFNGTVTATTFAGALSGNATTATTATTATNIGVIDAGGDTVTYILLAGAITGDQSAKTDSALSYNSSTNAITGAVSWEGNVIESAYLDADTMHLSGTQTVSGTKTFTANTTTFGAGGTGSNDAYVIADAGSATGGDPQFRLMRNGVLLGALYILADANQDLILWTAGNGNSLVIDQDTGNITNGVWTATAIDAAYLDLSTTVTLAGSQTITGEKLFSANVRLDNAYALYSSENMHFNIDSDSTAGDQEFRWAKNRSGTAGGTELMTLSETGDLTLLTGDILVNRIFDQSGGDLTIQSLVLSDTATTATSGATIDCEDAFAEVKIRLDGDTGIRTELEPIEVRSLIGGGTVLGGISATGHPTFNSVAYTFPADNGDANEFLQTNGAGVLTWAGALTNPLTVQLDIDLGTVTAAEKILDLTATWNDAADTFEGIFMNITTTAHHADSRFIKLQDGGIDVFNIDNTGVAGFYDAGTLETIVGHYGLYSINALHLRTTIFGSDLVYIDNAKIETAAKPIQVSASIGGAILGGISSTGGGTFSDTVTITEAGSDVDMLVLDHNHATVGGGLKITGGGGGQPMIECIRDQGATGTITIHASAGDPTITFNTPTDDFSIGNSGTTWVLSHSTGLTSSLIASADTDGNGGIFNLWDDSSTYVTVKQYNTVDGGRININDAIGASRALMYVDSSNFGNVWVYDDATEVVGRFKATANGGALELYNDNATPLVCVNLYVDGANGGKLNLENDSSAIRVSAYVDGSDYGRIELMDDASEVVTVLTADSSGGKLLIYNDDATPLSRITLDVNGNDGEIEVKDTSNVVTVTINGSTGIVTDEGMKWRIQGTADETLADGDLCYYKNDGGTGKWAKVDADAEATAGGWLAICDDSGGITIDTAGTFLLKGEKADTGLTIAATYYASTTPGAITSTKPSGTGDIVRVVGYAKSATVFMFDPDKTWLEI